MKKFLLTSATIIFVLSLAAQKVQVKGSVSYTDPVNKVYLSYSVDGERVTDSTEPNKGRFAFKAYAVEPTQAMLMVSFKKVDGKTRMMERTRFYLEQGTIKINIKDSLNNAVFIGSKTQKEYDLLAGMKKPYNEKSMALKTKYSEAMKNKDEAASKKIMEESRQNSADMDVNVSKKFLAEYPDSYVSLSVLSDFAGYKMNPFEIEPMFKALSPKLQNSQTGQAFAERIEIARKTAVGAMAMNFTQNDTIDKPVSLSDFRGKYVLLDFWASWCGPCRAENPNVVNAFQKYKNKNFTVLGVSLDQEGAKRAWMNAIRKDNLTWTQLSDLKGWDNAAAKQWGIRSIPQNFLIDPDGRIVAKNIRGKALIDKLVEILD